MPRDDCDRSLDSGERSGLGITWGSSVYLSYKAMEWDEGPQRSEEN